MANMLDTRSTKSGRAIVPLTDIGNSQHADTVATRRGDPAWTSILGVSSAAVVSADASTPVAVTAAPGASTYIVLDEAVISVGAALDVTLEEETSGTIILQLYMAENTTFHFKPQNKVKLATANKKLMVQASGAGDIAVTALYHTES